MSFSARRRRAPSPSLAGAGVGVRGPGVEATRTAGREDHRLRADRAEPAVDEIPGDDPLAAVVVDDELPGEELLVRLDVALHHLLVEHVDEHVARDVGGIGGARLAGSAERPLRDPAVGRAREDRSPALELVDVVRRLVAENLDRVLVSEVVGALHRVERVLLGIVLGGIAERRVDTALRRARVAADRVDLRHHRDVRAGVVGLDSRAHACAAGADDNDVMDRVHRGGRYLIPWRPLPSNERRANARHRAHRHGANGTRAPAGAGPGTELPALRRDSHQACRLVRRQGRGAPGPALDPAGAPHGPAPTTGQ